MSWQRTHRPKQVSDLHLSNVRQTLTQFMKRGEIPQTILFAGPKGTGKTSSARIIGALLNDETNEPIVEHQFFKGNKPKEKTYQEPDPEKEFNQKIYRGQSFVVQEMDAASNRGIDDIRDLKERVALPPQEGKMTVYILDEAHMLTKPAFNALLKLLEEPPAHVVFILATTELHKIPPTIKSRCSLVRFHKASHDELIQALTYVLDKEKIEYEKKALETIARRADGSFRDAVKLLQMVVIDGAVTPKSVEQILSSSVLNDIKQLLNLVLEKDASAIAKLFTKLRSRNVDEDFFNHSLLTFLHNSLLRSLGVKSGSSFTKRKIAQFLLKELAPACRETSSVPHLSLELKMLELIDLSQQQQGGGGTSGKKQFSQQNKQSQQSKVKQKSKSSKKKSKKVKKSTPNLDQAKKFTPTNPVKNGDSQKIIQHWSQLLAKVKKHNMTLEALLRSAKPLDSSNGIAKVAVYYQFHKEQLELPKFKEIINQCASSLAGGQVKLKYLLEDIPQQAELQEATNTSQADLATLAEEVLV